jgi:hypothetical protein
MVMPSDNSLEVLPVTTRQQKILIGEPLTPELEFCPLQNVKLLFQGVFDKTCRPFHYFETPS